MIIMPLPPILAGPKFEPPEVVSMLERGCVVYRDLWPLLSELADAVVGPVARLAPQEHSGIYVGDGQVISLDKGGDVISEGVHAFRRAQWTRCNIYVSCVGRVPVGDQEVACRAEEMVGTARSYNAVFDNCHQFASGCLTGDFENADNFLWMLKDTASKEIGADAWCVWRPATGAALHEA